MEEQCFYQNVQWAIESVRDQNSLNQKYHYWKTFCFDNKNMNAIIKFLLTGDNFMQEMHLRQPGFTYSACESFTKNKERIKKLKKQESLGISIRMN